MNILAIIPARGGSKGIPRKNIRLMNGKPLIYYSINNALNSKYITDVIVSTDDEEIKHISEICGAQVIKRPKELANDQATLDPVIYHATITMEDIKKKKYDIVITLQPTSPLLTVNTLDSALEKFINSEYDCFISAINTPHLSWKKEGEQIVPNYKQRLNRQQLPPCYFETGAFFFSRRKIVSENSRIGGKITVYEIPEHEAIDIDTVNDWIICESILKKKKIVLRCDGYKEIGMGHIYHCITLAHNLIEHDVTIVTNKKYIEGLEKIKSSNLKYVEIEKDEDFYNYLKLNRVDIVVNDCLDTTEEYIKNLKMLVEKVITIEDLGPGTKYADVVINALYDDNSIKNSYMGEKYVCLREEFILSKPKEFSEELKNVIVLFGGTDPANLTEKIYMLAKKEKYKNINFIFICGIGSSFIGTTENSENITILKNVVNLSEYMLQADMAFTSQGRTVYELAALGVPSIVMSQNKREMLHTFAHMNNGFVNLGLGEEINNETIENTFDWLINTPYIRKEMRELMLKHDLKNGIKNEINLILK